MPLNEQAKMCGARTRGGKQCRNPAVTGSDFCRVHAPVDLMLGTHPGRHVVAHGSFARGVVSPEEAVLYDEAFTALKKEFGLKLAADQMQAATAALHWAKWNMAVKANAPDLIGHYDRLFRQDLECLKATREKRDGAELKKTTPAEWAADIVAYSRKRKAEMANAGKEAEAGGDKPGESTDSCGQPTGVKP